MIRVEDADEALGWFVRKLEYEHTGRWESDTFANYFVKREGAAPEEMAVELTYNYDGRSYTMGDAWGHIAVRVPDVRDGVAVICRVHPRADRNDVVAANKEGKRVVAPAHILHQRRVPLFDVDERVELVEREYGARWSLDHTMIRVENAEEALGWYTRKLGYDLVRRSEHDSFALYFMQPGDAPREAMTVELTYNYDGRNYESGDAWGHLAVRAEDLQAFWETLMDRHAEDYRDPESCDNRYAFTKDMDGHEVEIVTP
ncbi:glyoxalase [Halobacteriales archaeon QH_10_67_22]|nr:MAG: glyoxalase [Halobacteriales archaeon QH_10_67_22]